MTDDKLSLLREKVTSLIRSNDSAHDLSHTFRVAHTAERIERCEGGDLTIIIPAALLHDIVVLPKNHPDSITSSDLAAERARAVLDELNYPSEKIPFILDAIRSHSFGKNVQPKTKEAQIVQDADRLDAIGAIGIARTFMVGGSLHRPCYNTEQPFPRTRNLDDKQYTLDHFFVKLFKLRELMNTDTGKKLAQERHDFMLKFIEQLRNEIET